MTRWRCKECGIGLETAERRRKRRGLRRLVWWIVKTCSPECTSKRQAKIADLKRRAVRTRAAPERGAWSCSECGCSKAEANRRRRKLGLARVRSRGQSTCTPKCRWARVVRLYAVWTAGLRQRASRP